MIIVLSPAKTLDFETPIKLAEATQPEFTGDARLLIERLRKLSAPKIATLMAISARLAELNRQRYADWSETHSLGNARQALLAFDGDVYAGLAAPTLTKADLKFAQRHVRILSGLYGVLRPFDLIEPYRLEMSIALANPRGKDLYAFWGGRLTQAVNAALAAENAKTLVNLASNEYFRALQPKALAAPVVQPVFEDWSGGKYKVVSFYAKRARGLMARFAIEQRIASAAGLRAFDSDGYAFADGASDESRWVFRRRVEQRAGSGGGDDAAALRADAEAL